MATIALAAAASSSGMAAGSVGAMMFVSFGSILDQAVLFPHLFPGEALDSGRAGDMPVGTASQGSPTQFAVGTKVRLPGSVIWQDERFGIPVSGSVGKGQRVVNHKYWIGIAIELGIMEIDSIEEVRADGQVIFQESTGTRLETSNQFSVDAFGGAPPFQNLQGPFAFFILPLTEGDLRDFNSGLNGTVTFAGFLSPNNGTYTVIETGLTANGLDTYIKVSKPPGGAPDFVDEASTAGSASASQSSNGWTVAQRSGNTPTLHLGTLVQTADADIIAVKGVGNVPAYRGISYQVWDSFPLTPYGGTRVPLFDYIANMVASAQTIPGAITAICNNGSFSLIDVSDLSGTAVGYVIAGRQELSRALAPMMLFYDLAQQSDGGVVRFFHRENAHTHDGSGLDEDSMKILKSPTVSKPGQVIVTHVNPNDDFRSNTVYQHISDHLGLDILEIRIPMATTPDNTREFAKRTLYRARENSRLIKGILPPIFVRVQEGDVLLNVPFEGQIYEKVEILSITQGFDFQWQFEGTIILTSGISFAQDAS